MVKVKICGLTRLSDVEAVIDAGANYVGFVFYKKSPRNISAELARELSVLIPPGIMKVGLFVDPEPEFLEKVTELTPLDMIQLHGSETPARVSEVKSMTGLPVMKAVPIATPDDVAQLAAYEAVADQILCDAKPAPGIAIPGGNGISFDWSVLSGYEWKKPWMLAGGLTPQNVAEAVRITQAQQVDVSSGVEYKPGLKNPEKIQTFIQATRM